MLADTMPVAEAPSPETQTVPKSEPASEPILPAPVVPVVEPTATIQPTPRPTPAEISEADIETVRSRYQSWLSAWQSMDLDGYMSYYWRGFTQKRAGKRAYGYTQQRQAMAANWAKQSAISVSSEQPDIETRGESIVLDANQSYDSTTWWDEGRKHLVWRKKDGEWMIVEESFTKRAGGAK